MPRSPWSKKKRRWICCKQCGKDAKIYRIKVTFKEGHSLNKVICSRCQNIIQWEKIDTKKKPEWNKLRKNIPFSKQTKLRKPAGDYKSTIEKAREKYKDSKHLY